MNILKITILVLSISLTACCTSKKASSDTANSNVTTTTTTTTTITNKMSDTEMMAAGFTSGTIVASKADGDCPYVIKTDGNDSVMFDPINIEDGYKKDGMNVWFSFRPLRMMNRCEKANPVELVEMKVKN